MGNLNSIFFMHFSFLLLYGGKKREETEEKQEKEKNLKGRQEKNQALPWILTWTSITQQHFVLKTPSPPSFDRLVKEATTDFARTFRILINFTTKPKRDLHNIDMTKGSLLKYFFFPLEFSTILRRQVIWSGRQYFPATVRMGGSLLSHSEACSLSQTPNGHGVQRQGFSNHVTDQLP